MYVEIGAVPYIYVFLPSSFLKRSITRDLVDRPGRSSRKSFSGYRWSGISSQKSDTAAFLEKTLKTPRPGQ
jgi:hypothetical protein